MGIGVGRRGALQGKCVGRVADAREIRGHLFGLLERRTAGPYEEFSILLPVALADGVEHDQRNLDNFSVVVCATLRRRLHHAVVCG